MSIPANAIETKRLFAVAARELKDASVSGLSEDGSFEHAYVAALTLATIVVRAQGERIHGQDHHRLTFERLGQLAEGRWAAAADYLQHCRRRRNSAVYDIAGTVSSTEAHELVELVREMTAGIRAWLAEKHPELV